MTSGSAGDGGTGVYVLGARINCGSSSSIASFSESDSKCVSQTSFSGSGVRSRSWTSWKAGRVAAIAGVIMFGSVGRIFDIDNRNWRDVRRCGGEAGGGEPGEFEAEENYYLSTIQYSIVARNVPLSYD
jgi:hypothetical protein